MQRNQNNSSHFEWSLADDSLLREKLQEFLNHVLACSTQLQNDLETINQQSLELNAEIECIVASINHISNFRFIDQHIDEDCFPTPVREVLNNVVDDKKKTLVSLTNAIRRGLEDMKNLRDVYSANMLKFLFSLTFVSIKSIILYLPLIPLFVTQIDNVAVILIGINSICLTPTIIGSREFYVSISSSEATAVECFVRSSAIQAAPFLSPTFQSSVDYANEGQNDLQAPVVALTSSSLIAPSTKNSVETVSVFPSALSGISSLDKLKRLTVLSTDSDENVSCYGARAHRNGDLTISKNPTIGETVLSQSYMHDLPTFDAECCSSNSDCPPSPQVRLYYQHCGRYHNANADSMRNDPVFCFELLISSTSYNVHFFYIVSALRMKVDTFLNDSDKVVNHPMIKTSALDYSMPENLFESGDKDLKEDVFVGDSSNVKQAHVDFGKTSAIKMPVQAQITNKYADMFESDTDDELVFPHQRLSLLTSYSNKTSDVIFASMFFLQEIVFVKYTHLDVCRMLRLIKYHYRSKKGIAMWSGYAVKCRIDKPLRICSFHLSIVDRIERANASLPFVARKCCAANFF
ncbi:hypothetical protein DICVIV_11453 [Dictyocaulus viviparus]|uniref:Uncharacterized protein n=1 Tax=Dictyocaulus viviparus TaxID=29172 RepID=A0A0D8XFQ5_DICVI|nr:hypothetical protein DICVIV_11453 [Dictyocaulus viviparus]